MYIFSSFTANTLFVHKFKCLASFTKCTCSSLVFLFFFCTVLQFFALVFSSALATRFESWFQFGDWFFGSGSIVASGKEKIFPALRCGEAGPASRGWR